MLVCVECGDVIVGEPHVERVDASEHGAQPELAFWCAACAYVEFVTGTGPTRPRLPRVPANGVTEEMRDGKVFTVLRLAPQFGTQYPSP